MNEEAESYEENNKHGSCEKSEKTLWKEQKKGRELCGKVNKG